MSGLDRRTFDAIVAEAAPTHDTLIALAPVSPLGTLVSAARQGMLDRRIVTAAVVPLRHVHLGTKNSVVTRDALDMAELVDIVWVCVTAGQAPALLDAGVPALDAAWLLAGPLGTLTDGRNPARVIAGRLDPNSPAVTSSLFRDLPQMLSDVEAGHLSTLHQTRRDVIHFWGDLAGITVDLSRLRIYSKLSEEDLMEAASLAQRELGASARKWELAASLCFQWPGTFRDLVVAVKSLSEQNNSSTEA